MSLLDYQTLVDALTRDDAGKLAPEDRDTAIIAAVARYSKDRPRTKVEDRAAATPNTLPLPAAWEADSSVITSLEHPIGEVPPVLIEPQRYGLYNSPTATVIMLLDAVPVGASVRASFTVSHALTETADTIPVRDREPAACWAAAMLCDQLATLYSGDTDSTVQADSVEHGSKAQEFASRARGLRQRYFNELGIEPKRNVAAGAVVNLDMSDSLGGDRLTHPRRFR